MTATILTRLNRLVAAGLDAHLAVDAPFENPQLFPRVHYVASEHVLALNLTEATYHMTKRAITAWERGIVFCWKQAYDHCWFAEDDVRWEDPQTIRALVDGYAPDPAGIISKFHSAYRTSPGERHFIQLCGAWLEPLGSSHLWVKTFNPLCRMSRSLIRGIIDVAARNGKLCFFEGLFSSIAGVQRLGLSFFGVSPPPGSPRICSVYRANPPFSEER